jgi:F-box-like
LIFFFVLVGGKIETHSKKKMQDAPNEILTAIFEFLKPRDLLGAEHVCSWWRGIIAYHQIWARWYGNGRARRRILLTKSMFLGGMGRDEGHWIFVPKAPFEVVDLVAYVVHLGLIGDGERVFLDNYVVSKRSRDLIGLKTRKVVIDRAPVLRVFLEMSDAKTIEYEYRVGREDVKVDEWVGKQILQMCGDLVHKNYSHSSRGIYSGQLVRKITPETGIVISLDHGKRQIWVGTISPENFTTYREMRQFLIQLAKIDSDPATERILSQNEVIRSALVRGVQKLRQLNIRAQFD